MKSARPRAALGSILLVGLVGGLLVLSPSSALGADDSGNISVNITDGSTPTPSASPTTGSPDNGDGSNDGSSGSGSSGSGSSGSGSGSSGTGSSGTGGSGAGGSGVPAPGGGAPADLTPSGSEVSVAGMLYVGGLNASATPSPNPAEGTVDVWFTVRNASTSPIDATAKFWLDGAVFNNHLDEVNEVAVTALQAGETRVVSAKLQRGGQWTFLAAHVTLTPPDTVDGTALTPVTRDATVVLFPWLVAVLLVLAALGVIIFRVVRSAAPVPMPVVAS